MTLPRSKYVREGQEGVYHCFTRCVRRAFLCGIDPLCQRDFSHRRVWLVDRLRYLSTVFAIDVCAYAVMWNHYHTVLRTRPDIVAGWSDREVARRWIMLFPKCYGKEKQAAAPSEENISALARCPQRIEKLRKRLCSLSWFMGRLNEFIAREANKEDKVKGRFWESRFRCQALLDESAIATCMVYVDLNLIRAGLAATPEESEFTSIQERIQSWQREAETTASTHGAQDPPNNEQELKLISGDPVGIPGPAPGRVSATSNRMDTASSSRWLCPISSELQQRGILQMTAVEYFELVDKSGRLVRSDKRMAIASDLTPILLRIGAKPEAWLDLVSCFESKFCLASGLLVNLRNFAQQIGRRWLKGIVAARTAFA